MEPNEYTALFNKWDGMYDVAVHNMELCAAASTEVFIEVAAQHPLKEGLYPDWEFEARLHEAVKRLLDPKTHLDNPHLHPKQVHIYVPGGRHKKDGVEDKVSLSEAGITWLKEHDCGLHTQLHGGDELNRRLTNGRGIFNGEDECDAAVRMFKELKAGRFICICSQGQMMRKALAYIQRGYYPEFVVLPGRHHNPVWEAFHGIPRLIGTGEAMSEAERLARVADRSAEPVFVYHEYSEDKPYGEQIIRTFQSEEKGLLYLRQRAEAVLGESWDQIVAHACMEDTVSENHVSVNIGGVCKFFVLDAKVAEE